MIEFDWNVGRNEVQKQWLIDIVRINIVLWIKMWLLFEWLDCTSRFSNSRSVSRKKSPQAPGTTMISFFRNHCVAPHPKGFSVKCSIWSSILTSYNERRIWLWRAKRSQTYIFPPSLPLSRWHRPFQSRCQPPSLPLNTQACSTCSIPRYKCNDWQNENDDWLKFMIMKKSWFLLIFAKFWPKVIGFYPHWFLADLAKIINYFLFNLI